MSLLFPLGHCSMLWATASPQRPGPCTIRARLGSTSLLPTSISSGKHTSYRSYYSLFAFSWPPEVARRLLRWGSNHDLLLSRQFLYHLVGFKSHKLYKSKSLIIPDKKSKVCTREQVHEHHIFQHTTELTKWNCNSGLQESSLLPYLCIKINMHIIIH